MVLEASLYLVKDPGAVVPLLNRAMVPVYSMHRVRFETMVEKHEIEHGEMIFSAHGFCTRRPYFQRDVGAKRPEF